MQNVILQMGLHLISIDGMRIKATKQNVLLCYSCGSVCKDQTKIFCPSCGNYTLKKTFCRVRDDGSMYVAPLRYTPTKKGSKYSIPLNKNIILTEEQYHKEVRKARGHNKKKVDGVDFFSGGGAFMPEKEVVVGFGRKNPNEAHHRVGKKKSHKK